MMNAKAHAVTRYGATVYVVRIIHDVGTPQQRTRLATAKSSAVRIWFDEDAARRHARSRLSHLTLTRPTLFD